MMKLLKVDEAAGRVRKKTSTMRAWIFKRKIGYVKLGRSVLIPESEVTRLIEEGTVSARPSSKEGM
jgi:excisionase family DNA binding protein